MQSTLIKSKASQSYCRSLCLPRLACCVVCNSDACNYIKIYFFSTLVYIYIYSVERCATKQKKGKGKEEQHVEWERERQREMLSRCHGDEQSDSNPPSPPHSHTFRFRLFPLSRLLKELAWGLRGRYLSLSVSMSLCLCRSLIYSGADSGAGHWQIVTIRPSHYSKPTVVMNAVGCRKVERKYIKSSWGLPICLTSSVLIIPLYLHIMTSNFQIIASGFLITQ